MEWNTVKEGGELPHLHERVLCILGGEPIVLELQEESPSYDETFKAFLYWHEPYDEYMQIEWHEVTHWARVESPISIKAS